MPDARDTSLKGARNGPVPGKRCRYGLNVAVMLVSVVGVTVHGSAPGHDGSLHPTKLEPGPGVAVSVRAVFGSNSFEYDVVHLMPVGELVTEPDPTIVGYLKAVRVSVS